MTDDFRFAFRQLRKNPGFAAIAIVTLALGIGAAAAMFGLIQGVLLSPPPYADPDRVVLVSPARSDGASYRRGATIGQWTSWRQARTLEPAAIYRWTFNFLVLPDGSESMGGMVVTPSYFRVLGLRPLLGREFVDAELARPNVPPSAVILGYDLWQRKFNGDPGIVGRTIRMSRMPAPVPVVGVMPQGIRFLPDPGASSEPNYDLNARVDFWFGVAPDESRPTSGAGNAITRLRDGATLDRGADRDYGALRRARTGGPVAAGDHRGGRARARRPQPRWPALAGAALRIGGARFLHRVRQRCGSSPDARVAAPLGVRDALGARRGPMAAVPPGVDRKPRPRLRRRGARRGPRYRHCLAAQGHRRTGGAACRCRPHRLAGLRLSGFWLRSSPPASLACCPPPAPRFRIGCRGSRARGRPPAGRSAACSAPSRRCRLC